MSSVPGDMRMPLALECFNFTVSPGLTNSTDDELISAAFHRNTF